MYKKINKTKQWKRLMASFVCVFFVANPLVVFAQTTYDQDDNVTVSGNNIAIRVNGFNENGFLYADYVDPTPAHIDGNGDLVPLAPATCQDTALNPNSVITSGVSPASGFCAGIAKCNNAASIAEIVDCSVANNCAAVNSCGSAVADAYNNKIVDALQTATDAKIEDSGLDKTKANDALESCAGDLACINNVLSVLQSDSSFTQSSSTDSSAALTVASLSDLINSSSSTSTDTGVINSESNDVMGLSGKQPSPKVEVAFSSDGAMQQGSRMTATAVPGFFNNASDPSKLYFTWYLKRDGCEKDNSPSEQTKIRCDFDGNDRIDENDWKIAAARIIISKSFENEDVDYSEFPDGMDSLVAGFKAIPEIDEKKGTLDIGWRKGFLRNGSDDLYEDNGDSDDVKNCYIQAPKSGKMYELRKTTSKFDDICPSGYHNACVKDQDANCKVFNTDPAYTEVFGACAVSSENGDNANIFCSVKDDDDLKNFKGTVVCDNDDISACVRDDSGDKNFSANTEFKDSLQNVLGTIIGTKIGTTIGVDDTMNNKMCTAVARPDQANPGFFLTNTNPLISSADEKCSVVLDKIINGTKNSSGNVLIAGNASLSPKCTFEKDANLCQHLFPVLPKSIKTDDDKQAVTGDGEFNLAEKQFWGADPSKPSTSGNEKDEQRAVGLGIDEFSWMYSVGDQVGVVVEGDSAYPSSHNDSSYQRTWAFSNGTCGVLDDMEKGSTIDEDNPDNNTRGFYVESVGFLTANIDLNDCLEDNLLDPIVDSNAKLTVQLNASPANPINDPGGRGDILTISSLSTNTLNQSGLMYKWSVQKSRDGSTAPIDTTNWVDITTGLESGGAISVEDIQGLEKRNLAINLNLEDSFISSGITGDYNGQVFYLRVKVDITGTAADGSQNAQGTVIVRVGQQQNEIRSYQVAANNTGMLTMGTDNNSEICATQGEKATCYVTKNEILGLSISNTTGNSATDNSNFSWTVNGNAISCSSSVSSQCVSGNKVFVPVLGNVGEAVDVVAKGVSSKNEAIEVSRHFVIIAPQVQITSLDQSSAWPKLLGYYKDLNSNKYPDYSTQVLEANAGSTVTLGAIFYPQYKAGQAGFDWAIDGQVLSELHNQNQIKISIDKLSGDSYNIGLVALYSPGSDDQVNSIRKALLKNWSISPEDVIEQDDNANIQLNVVEGASQPLAVKDKSNFGASLITHLPEQIMFLFKITLTSVLLLFGTGLLFAFMPETLFRKEGGSN